MAPRACYRTLNLFGDSIKIPIAYYIRSEENKETATKYGYEGESLRQLYVLPKKNAEGERIEKVLTVDDIEKVIERDEIQSHIVNESGNLVKLSSIPGLEELMKEHAEKKKQADIEILGIFDLCDLPFDRFNGRQYYTTPEKAGKKKGNPKDLQLYQCLISYLEENKKYIHIRYYWNCTTAQEISAMYVKNGSLIISGMYPDFSLREILKTGEIAQDKDLKNKLIEKLNKFYIENAIETEKSIEQSEKSEQSNQPEVVAEVIAESVKEEKSKSEQSEQSNQPEVIAESVKEEKSPEPVQFAKLVHKLDKNKLYTLDWFDYYYDAFTSKNFKKNKKEIGIQKLSEDNKEDILNILDGI